MNAQGFYKPEPREPWRDWRTYSMLAPILSNAVGASIFFALGLAFAEVANIPDKWRTPLVLVASFGVAIGSTFGSIGSGIEIFRKAYKRQATGWDWASLTISVVTTIVGMVMGFAALLGATEEWSRLMTIYGCIVVGAFASLDTGGDMIELGGLFGSYEDRIEQWRDEREAYNAKYGIVEAPIVRESPTLSFDPSWAQAGIDDVRAIAAQMNGQRATLTEEQLLSVLHQNHLRPREAKTVRRWVRTVREEAK